MRRCLLTWALLLSVCTVARSRTLVIVQVSDPQMGFYAENGDLSYEIARLSEAVERINRLRPDAVVFTGDLVHNWDDPAQHEAFAALAKKIGRRIRVYYLPGNHDVERVDGSVNTAPFTDIYGADRFSDRIGRTKLTGFNSVLLKDEIRDPSKEERQFEWLAGELTGDSGVVCRIVFAHHPLFLYSHEEQDGYSVIVPQKRMRYLSLFERGKVSAFFAGHFHNNAEGVYHDIPIVTTSAVGRQLGEASPGVRIITVKNGHVAHRYYDISDIPSRKKELEWAK